MTPSTLLSPRSLLLSCALLCAMQAHAGTPAAPSPSTADTDTRYGLFNGLDHRSQYGMGLFPEPFLVDDTDLEQSEARFDWFNVRQPGGTRSHQLKAEFEQGIGLMTLELEVPFTIESTPGEKMVSGFENIQVSARYPFYQFVSRDGLIDSTFGAGVELGLPVRTSFSRNTELVPKIFNDTKIGNFTLQTLLGYSLVRGGGGDAAGVDTLEYQVVAGYAIQKPCAGVEQFIPVFEFAGSTQLNKTDSGHTSLTGDVGFRLNLSAIGHWQPRLGIVYAFPIQGAHSDLHSGIYTSLVFDL